MDIHGCLNRPIVTKWLSGNGSSDWADSRPIVHAVKYGENSFIGMKFNVAITRQFCARFRGYGQHSGALLC